MENKEQLNVGVTDQLMKNSFEKLVLATYSQSLRYVCFWSP